MQYASAATAGVADPPAQRRSTCARPRRHDVRRISESRWAVSVLAHGFTAGLTSARMSSRYILSDLQISGISGNPAGAIFCEPARTAVCPHVEQDWNATKTYDMQASLRTVIYLKFILADDESYTCVFNSSRGEAFFGVTRIVLLIPGMYSSSCFTTCSSSNSSSAVQGASLRVWLSPPAATLAHKEELRTKCV